jgi:hypothetical protein
MRNIQMFFGVQGIDSLFMSPNNPLQRAGMDKLLGRGRMTVVLGSSLPRPRADTAVAGR